MRLCVVAHKECWQDASGAWMSSGGFPLQMTALASLFAEVTLVVVRGQPLKGGTALPAAARVVALTRPKGSNFRRKLSVLLRLPQYLPRIGSCVRAADVTHAPLPGDIQLLGFLVAILQRKRVIARYGGSWATNSETTLANRLTKWLMRTLAGGRNVMLATGIGTTQPASGMHWVFATTLSRAELDEAKPDLDRGLSELPRLIYIGRLSPEKGVDVLVEAMALLKAHGHRVSLTVAGDGPERERLETLARDRGCEASIRFAGQLSRQDLRRHIAGADICVQPSRTEGFSKAWLDAMAGGLPVVASRVGAASGVIGEEEERGWLVCPGDAPALATRLGSLLTAPRDWAATRRRCRQFVEGLTLEAWASRIGELCSQQWGLAPVDGKPRS